MATAGSVWGSCTVRYMKNSASLVSHMGQQLDERKTNLKGKATTGTKQINLEWEKGNLPN